MTEALKPSEVLSRAADLIEPEGAWTQGVNAADAKGNPTRWNDPKAACFCLYGAIGRASGSKAICPAEPLRFVRLAVRTLTLSVWNDHRGRKQSTVVAALRKASELARSEGQ